MKAPSEGGTAEQLPERLRLERDYVICTPDINFNVSPHVLVVAPRLPACSSTAEVTL